MYAYSSFLTWARSIGINLMPEAERGSRIMHVTEAIKIALKSLWANKRRSILTLLGVVIGVAAVIAVVTFVSGINDYVAQKVFNLGADVFIISKMSTVETNVDHFLAAEKRKDLTMEDYQAVLAGCRHCQYVGAVLQGS